MTSRRSTVVSWITRSLRRRATTNQGGSGQRSRSTLSDRDKAGVVLGGLASAPRYETWLTGPVDDEVAEAQEMQLGRVVGQVVATVRSPGFDNVSLLLVQDTTEEGATGPTCVAVDLIGAGEGDVVLMTTGSAARVAAGAATPTDRAVVAIADSVIRHGTASHRTA